MSIDSKVKPTVMRSEQLTQASYHLPHRVYHSAIYPVASPNGSTIIVYGHEHGIRVLWRGGKGFKRPSATPAKAPANTSNADSIIILDSDEEDQPTAPQPISKDVPEFEDEEDEADMFNPSIPIIQDLDLPLGTAVLRLSFPPIPPDPAMRSPRSIPALASEKLIMVVGCMDCTTRLITLPLLPPTKASKNLTSVAKDFSLIQGGRGSWGETIVTFKDAIGQNSIPTDVAITFTPSDGISPQDTDMEDEESNSHKHSRSIRRSSSRNRHQTSEEHWDILLASTSPENRGVLLVYRLPIVETNGKYELLTEFTFPSQTHYLPSPASSLAFNSSLSRARRHSHLLVVDSQGAVRIFECLSPLSKSTTSASSRRSSAFGEATAEQGSWLLSLYPGFMERTKSQPTQLSRRKRIIDAQWILEGKGVMVLLENAEWGIWDIDGTGPSAMIASVLGVGQGVRGAAQTQFAISGFVETTPPKQSSLKTTVSKVDAPAPSIFAPMTPHSRKVRQEVLFSGPEKDTLPNAHGGLSVWRINDEDEAVGMWYESSVAIIPSLKAYWEAELRKTKSGGAGNLLGRDRASKMVRLDALSIGSQLISNISLFGTTSWTSNPVISNGKSVLPLDMLISGDRYLYVLSPPGISETHRDDSEDDEDEDVTMGNDELKLATGDLELNGINRLLQGMSRNGTPGGAKRKVGFLGASS